MAAAVPFIPLIAAGLGAAGSMYSANQAQSAYSDSQDTAYERQIESEGRQKTWAAQQQEQQKAWITEQQNKQTKESENLRAENEALYKKYAYPSQEEMTAKQNQMSADLANERTKRLDSLARNASLRGWGQGSGTIAAAGGQVESDYLTSLGKMTNDLTQYSNKAQFAYPFSTSTGFTPMSYSTTYMPTYGSSAGNYNTSSGSSPLASALGMLAYNSGKLNGTDTVSNTDTSSYAYIPYTDGTDWSGWTGYTGY